MYAPEEIELRRLLSSLCDGELTDVDQVRLVDLLAASADARRQYLEYLDLHAHLLTLPVSAADRIVAGDLAARAPGAGELVASSQPASAVRQRPARQTGRYGLVAATTLAASLLFQLYLAPWPWRDRSNDPLAVSRTDKVAPVIYVATLTHAADCVWQGQGSSWKPGSRLVPGDVRLLKGIARIHFDSGADLVLQGPAALCIQSSTAALMLSGRVVFRSDDASAPFDLQTPSSNLSDIGTEYAVAVSPEGEEVHVFDGEVERTPRSGTQSTQANAQHLAAGEARRYDARTTDEGQPTALDPAKFVREFPQPKPPLADPAAGLLAYEGFDYADPKMLDEGRAGGGKGWSTPWRAGFSRPAEGVDKNLLPLNIRETLNFPGASTPSIGGSFDFTGFTKYFRRLATPIRLDRDGVYYISYLFRRGGPQSDPQNAVVVLLRNSDELEGELTRNQPDSSRRMNLGVERYNDLFTSLQKVGARSPLPLTNGETYLLVVKIVASAKNPDQVFMRVYAAGEPLSRDEPGSWSVVGPSFQSDLVFDWLEVHINSKKRQTIDEIRVGSSWLSVAAPWMSQVALKDPR